MADENQDQKRIADLSQQQLGVSQAQFGKINAQNEALGAVILELAAAQAQAGEIEERAIKREKFYRRRDFIFDQIVQRFRRVSAKKAAIAAENQANKDLIEQKAQVDNAVIIANNSSTTKKLTFLMQRDIARLSDFMMGNKLQDEENRKELLAALKKDGKGGDLRGEFEEKKYSGFLKTLGKLLIQIPFFLIGFFQGYFKQLSKLLRAFGAGPVIDSVSDFFKTLRSNLVTRIRGIFSAIGAKLKPITDTITKVVKRLKSNKFIGKGFELIGTLFNKVSGFFKGIVSGPKGKAIANIAKSAKVFGTLLGRLFLPINIIIGAFAAFKGFMKGYKEGGIVEGLKQGVIGVFDALIGSVVQLGANILAFLLNLVGLGNTGEAIKGYFDDILGGIKGFFSSYIDLVKAIFTLDFEGIKTALGGIFDSIKQFLFAPIQVFKGLITDIFGTEEEGGGFMNKIKSIYDAIVGFLAAPFEKVKSFIDNVNPFGGPTDEELKREIEEEKARIARSQSGVDEYFGRETKGIEKSQKKIAELEKKLAQNGAAMAAQEKENADMRAIAAGAAAGTTIINNIDNSNNSNSSVANFQQELLMDEGPQYTSGGSRGRRN